MRVIVYPFSICIAITALVMCLVDSARVKLTSKSVEHPTNITIRGILSERMSGHSNGGARPQNAAPPLDSRKIKLEERFKKHYQLCFSGAGIGYSNVLEILQAHLDRDVLTDDLFKDVCVYVGERTQIADWVEEQKKDLSNVSTNLVTQITNSTLISDVERIHQLALVSTLEEYKGLPEALRRIFTSRLKSRYQIESVDLIDQLDAVTLRDVGPELIVPIN
jgi:hypothetical protein